LYISIVMSGLKGVYHPNAYLQNMKNVKSGLEARTKILGVLDKQPVSASAAARLVSMTYDVVMYHLRRLEFEQTVCRRGKRPCVWVLTGFGQKRL
jgi:DNA-binding transcriptional ArsR family regulator